LRNYGEETLTTVDRKVSFMRRATVIHIFGGVVRYGLHIWVVALQFINSMNSHLLSN
jgi:hypothetical protein